MPYAHPEALVSTEFLAAHLDDPAISIVDGTFKLPGVTPTAAEDYAKRHIPGAVFFDIDAIADARDPLPHMLPSAEEFARSVGRLGLGDGQKIVVYDGFGLGSAPRVWWSLRVFGHGDVAILDGGLPKWLAEERPVTDAVPHPPERRFTARLARNKLRDQAQLMDNLASKRERIIDARAAGRFAGTAPEPRAGLRSGHIPGSLNLPSDRLSHPKARTVLPAEALEAQFRALGVTKETPIVCSCGSGVTACALAFGLHLIGWPEPSVYDGSWSEWGRPGDTPIATGDG
ncbi:MAG TPA: 3-mercaptopyruvate sulfurtransferase [Stellaceae bacterium]|nr:3-mercaptopyruvate sulfurtransferase [Stellaceae bacterium]